MEEGQPYTILSEIVPLALDLSRADNWSILAYNPNEGDNQKV